MFLFKCVGFSYIVLDLVYSAIFPSDWLAGPCPNDAYVDELDWVSLHRDQLLQDPFTFKQNSSYELFWHMNCFFFIIFLVSFSLL